MNVSTYINCNYCIDLYPLQSDPTPRRWSKTSSNDSTGPPKPLRAHRAQSIEDLSQVSSVPRFLWWWFDWSFDVVVWFLWCLSCRFDSDSSFDSDILNCKIWVALYLHYSSEAWGSCLIIITRALKCKPSDNKDRNRRCIHLVHRPSCLSKLTLGRLLG